MTFHCPHCSLPIDPALVRAAANKDAATRERPRAKGQAKRGCMHERVATGISAGTNIPATTCLLCHRPLRWHATDKRWRIRYSKQKSPAE